MSRATTGRATTGRATNRAAAALCVLAIAMLGACGGEPDHHILVNEDGLDVNMMGMWYNVSSSTGKKTGHYSFVGDLGASVFMGMTSLSFSFASSSSLQLPNGKWINNLDLVSKKSDLPDIPVGTPLYATAYVWGDNAHFNLAIDTSLPYPQGGSDYPSIGLPLFRAFRK